MTNIPYIVIKNENSVIDNPITKGNPYYTLGPNRKARRLQSKGKSYIQYDPFGNQVGIFRKNGSNSRPSGYNPFLNSTMKSIMKNLNSFKRETINVFKSILTPVLFKRLKIQRSIING